MPGFELFDEKEKKEVNSVMETGILFRYGFNNLRNNQWKAKTLEKKLAKKLNVKYCHLCSSGTAAIYAALNACNIGFGDEVIVPPFTFVATIEAIILAGAIPIFSEIDNTLCLSPNHLKHTVTKKTKAIIVVHMCGSMAKIDKINNFCKLNKLILIEDTCQAIGASFKNKYLGTFGKIGCLSFDFVKTITCGEGGAIITNCEETYTRVKSFSDHGHDHIGIDRGKENHMSIGTNLRISELNAAIGIAQLKKLDMILEIQKNNKSIIKKKMKSIKNIKFREIPDENGDSSTFLSFMMPNIHKARETMLKFNKSDINECFHWIDNKWHYIRHWDHFKSLKSYAKLAIHNFPEAKKYAKIQLPKSDAIMEKTISLQIKLTWDTIKTEQLANKIVNIIKYISI